MISLRRTVLLPKTLQVPGLDRQLSAGLQAQLARHLRKVLIPANLGGGTHDFLSWPAKPRQRLAHSA